MIYSPVLLLRQFFTVSYLWLLQWSHSYIRFIGVPLPHQLHLSDASFSCISELSMTLVKMQRKSIEEAGPSSIAGRGLCEIVFSSVLKQLNKNWSRKLCLSHVYHLLLSLHFLTAVLSLLNSVEKLISCFLKDYFFSPPGCAWFNLTVIFLNTFLIPCITVRSSTDSSCLFHLSAAEIQCSSDITAGCIFYRHYYLLLKQ